MLTAPRWRGRWDSRPKSWSSISWILADDSLNVDRSGCAGLAELMQGEALLRKLLRRTAVACPSRQWRASGFARAQLESPRFMLAIDALLRVYVMCCWMRARLPTAGRIAVVAGAGSRGARSVDGVRTRAR